MHSENERPVGALGPHDVRDALFALALIPPVTVARFSLDVLTASAKVASELLEATPLKSSVVQLEERWQRQIAVADGVAERALAQILDWVLDRVDIDAIVAQRVDVDAIIDRVDLVAIASRVIAELDLPEIVRDSSQTMAAETVDGLRVHGMAADRSLSEFIDRLLRRRSDRGSPDIDPSGGLGQTT